ncbi:MAG: hypothetical protein H0T54_08590 [Geodermatophilaceae bacterium]|nr:hypothetical protein [Geodermatophilaceae bacterium]
MSIELRVWMFEDSGRALDDGGFDTFYAGWLYQLAVDGCVYALRRYRDTSKEVSFQGTRQALTPCDSEEFEGPEVPIRGGVPYTDPVFVKAAQWFLHQPGIERLTVSTSDPEYPGQSYVPVDPSRLPMPALPVTEETSETSEPPESEWDGFLGYDAQPLTSHRWRRRNGH